MDRMQCNKNGSQQSRISEVMHYPQAPHGTQDGERVSVQCNIRPWQQQDHKERDVMNAHTLRCSCQGMPSLLAIRGQLLGCCAVGPLFLPCTTTLCSFPMPQWCPSKVDYIMWQAQHTSCTPRERAVAIHRYTA